MISLDVLNTFTGAGITLGAGILIGMALMWFLMDRPGE